MSETPAEKAQRIAREHGAIDVEPEQRPAECIHGLMPATCTICRYGPSLGPVSHCRSCGAEIVWCKTEAGRNIPVDAAPSPQGNLVRVGTFNGSAQMSAKPPRVAALLRANDQPMFVSHFVTCADADSFRRRKDLR